MIEELVIGLDIGGTNTLIGLVDKYANVLGKIELKTQDYTSAQMFVDAICQKIFSLIQQHPNSIVRGIGVGVPNGNYHRGTVEFAPNLPWKGVVPLADMIREKIEYLFKENLENIGQHQKNNIHRLQSQGFPVLLTNDANAAAIGEMVYGHAVNIRDFIYITLGTGLGCGIVVNGRLVYGHDGFAGELGHVIMIPNGRLCGCGNQGCLETYCSSTGVKRTYIELHQKNHLPLPVSEQEITSLYVYQRALDNDPLALETFDFTAEILGLAMANSVKYTSPEAIFLFGGLSFSGDLLLKPTIKHFEKNLLPIHKNKIKILFSGLNEGNVAILGAGSLIWKMKN